MRSSAVGDHGWVQMSNTIQLRCPFLLTLELTRNGILHFLVVLSITIGFVSTRRVTFTNRCGQNIWIATLTNDRGPLLREGIQGIKSGGTVAYQIPDKGWAGRFWPKLGCASNGNSCRVGQAIPPCPSKGCQPPADTKIEFFFPARGSNSQSWYDISLVDGYSLAAKIVPSQRKGSCRSTNCNLSLRSCPTNERNVGDLRVIMNGNVVQCLSPCKKWNYSKPYGLGRSEQQEPGRSYCCPTPPVSSPQCRRGPVEGTTYVKLVNKSCPSAYSYAYDDEGSLHTCPSNTDFSVTFC